MKKSEQYQYQNSKAMSFLDNMEIFKGDLDREKIEDIKKLASCGHNSNFARVLGGKCFVCELKKRYKRYINPDTVS